MTPELQNYLEQTHAEFEAARFHGERFWRAPVCALKGTLPYSVFEQFSELLPDHPSDLRDVYYLFQSASGDYSILFRCAHFEHAWSEDLPTLAKFIDSAATALTSFGSGHVELLDGNGEQLHIRFFSPHEHIITLLQSLASRTAAQPNAGPNSR
jgi:hypothetical protein